MATELPVPLPPHEDTHPYAVHMSVTLGSNLELKMSEDDMRFSFSDNSTIRIVKESPQPRDQALFLKPITVDLEAFRTASEAERAGKLLVFSLLWVAASKGVTIIFNKRTGDFPFAVRNRTLSSGFVGHVEMRVYSNVSPEEFFSIAGEAYKLGSDVAPHVLTSMEFYASSRMEATDRARFISLMIALEALSEQDKYGNDIATLLNELASQVESSALLAGKEKEVLRSSLAGRIRGLREESVRQAILRTVKQYIKESETIRFVDESYDVRSKILHTGVRASDLHARTQRLEDVIRQIYSRMLGLPLMRPPHPL